MKTKPVISVVIPCHNSEQTIEATLQSVANQSVQNTEVIAVDDGSIDSTPKILNEFAARDPRFKVILINNGGVSCARNAGYLCTSAPYVAFLDSDDIWHPTYLERLYEFCNANPHVGIAFTSVRIVDKDGVPTGAVSSRKVTDLETLDFMSGNPTTTGSNLFIRRAVLKELFGFVEGMNHAEDQLFLLQARLAGWIVAGISTPLVDYRQSDTGQSSDLEAMRHGWEQMIEMVMKTHPDEIAPLVKKARAQEMLYLSRRAMRLGIGISAALGYAKSALAANPLIVVDRSIQILAAAASTVAEYSSPKSYRVIKQEIAS